MSHTKHMNEQEFQFATNGEYSVVFGEPTSHITIWSQDDYKKSINLPQGVTEYSDRGMILFQKWCFDTKTYYYAKPREDFFDYEAIELAKKAGATYLYLEDLS